MADWAANLSTSVLLGYLFLLVQPVRSFAFLRLITGDFYPQNLANLVEFKRIQTFVLLRPLHLIKMVQISDQVCWYLPVSSMVISRWYYHLFSRVMHFVCVLIQSSTLISPGQLLLQFSVWGFPLFALGLRCVNGEWTNHLACRCCMLNRSIFGVS